MKSPYPGDGDVVGILLHDVRHSLPTSSSACSRWPVAARGSLVDVVMGAKVLAHTAERAVLAHNQQRAQRRRAHGPPYNEYALLVIRNLHH
jgi:hypothetical protein